MRIAIAGGPRCGKTTFARTLRMQTLHTDDAIPLGWSEASTEVASWFDRPGSWVIEGVTVPRALRKWLAAHRRGRPCDVIHWMPEPYIDLTTGQRMMAAACKTVWLEIKQELLARGVRIFAGRPPPR